MSWHHENSEYHPRTMPPRGHGLHTVARVQPMVPEVSVFAHQPSIEARQPLGTLNGTTPRRMLPEKSQDSLCATVPAKKPPLPAEAPYWSHFKPSEISRMETEKSMMSVVAPVQASKSEVNFNKEKALLSNPDDLFKVLNWQNEQLVRLQEQVRQLLACQQNQSSSFSGSDVAEEAEKSFLSSKSMPNLPPRMMVDTSTQMSTPSSPAQKKTRESSQLRHATDMFEEEVLSHEDLDPPSFIMESPQSKSSLPLGASAGQMLHFESQHEEIQQCHDVRQVENLEELIGQFGKIRPSEPEYTVDHTREESCEAVRRLRQMGASFITKEDLMRSNETSRRVEASMWYPQAMDPFQNTPSVASTSDYSLMINSAALKYLDDAQLTHLAVKNSAQKKTEISLEPANVTAYGLPEANLSMATKEFFTNNQKMFRPSQN